ncbi:MAG TPA: DUF2067 domain-containing protein [Desulfurococcales archaeon]|nr:DUF2067 domain-containing protein [Desulfurococcales archaeon]
MQKKTLVLSFPSDEAKEEFITTLLEKASLHTILIKSRGQKVYITILGTHDELKTAQALIKELVKDTLVRSCKRKGPKVYSEKDIIKLINRTVSLETLHIVLKELGYTSKYDTVENTVQTNADENTVKTLAEKIVYAVDNLRFRTTSTSVKRYISALYAITGMDIETIIDISINLNLLREEDNKLYMSKEWRSAIKEFIKYIKTTQEINTLQLKVDR